MCRCSSPEVDIIYNKLENFPFPEKCPAIYTAILYCTDTKPSTTERINKKCFSGFVFAVLF